MVQITISLVFFVFCLFFSLGGKNVLFSFLGVCVGICDFTFPLLCGLKF